MAWPFTRHGSSGAAVIGGTPDALLWLCTDAAPGRAGAITGGGRLDRNGDADAGLARRLRGLNLPKKHTLALLPPSASQLLQIEAPKVPPDEMKAAARWHVKDLIEGRVEDLTLDVMPVGDGQVHAHAARLFVAAARSDLIRERTLLAQAAGIELTVIDIAEAAQRNLQTALARADGLEPRATAALLRHGPHCLLTICAGGELYYARRLESPLAAPDAPAAGDGAGRVAAPIAADELPAFVDYGAEADAAAPADDTPRIVLELQRSFDVWERTWSALPLAKLSIELGPDTAAWRERFEAALGLPVDVLKPERIFPGFEQVAANDPALREALLPLAGALLRGSGRTL